jgi:hypothetical protein
MAISFNELVDAQKKLAEKQKLSAPEKVTADQLSKMLTREGVPSAGGGAKNIEKLIKSDKDILESQKKLNKNLERLNNVITKSSLGSGKPGPANVSSMRGEQLAGEQPLDYRSIGQRIKDKFMGRGGNKFDPNSYRYKFGSLRGLAETTGLVTKGSGGFVDKYLAVREEEKRSADVMGKLNPQMKNLSQFGGSQSKVNSFYLQKAKEASQSKRELQTEQERLEALRASGMSEEEIQRTTGGRRQIEKRDDAATKLINTDPRYKGESLGLLEKQKLGKKNDVSEEEKEQADLFIKNNDSLDTLVVLTEAENKRKEKSDKALLSAIKGIELENGNTGGGTLGRIMDKFKGSKSVPKGGGMLGGGAGLFAGLSVLAGVASIAAVGSAQKKASEAAKKGDVYGTTSAERQSQQYQQGAFSEFQDPTVAAENAKDEARRDLEAQAAKGNVKAQQALDNLGKPSMDPKIVKSKAKVEYMQKQGFTWSALKGKWVKAGTGFLGFGAQVASKEDLDKAEAASSLAVPQTISKQTSDSVYNQSAENDTAKLNSKDTSQNNIVNAPTTINKQTQNTIMKTPIRSQETSIRSYYRSRFST